MPRFFCLYERLPVSFGFAEDECDGNDDSRSPSGMAKQEKQRQRLGTVLFVCDVIEPDYVYSAFVGLLHGQMHHGEAGSGAVPVQLVRLDPNGVAGANLLHLAALQLHSAES